MGRGRGDGNEDREIWGDLIAGKIDWLVWLLGITWDLDCMGCGRVVVVLEGVGCVVRGGEGDGGWIGGWGWMGLGWVMCMAPGMVMMVM